MYSRARYQPPARKATCGHSARLQSGYMADKSKRLRLLYAFLFVLALAAVGRIAWGLNFNYCKQQAERHEGEMMMMPRFTQTLSGDAQKAYWEKRNSHTILAKAYRQAAWYPWKLLFIDEHPPKP